MGKQEEDKSDAKGTENQKRRPMKGYTTKTSAVPAPGYLASLEDLMHLSLHMC